MRHDDETAGGEGSRESGEAGAGDGCVGRPMPPSVNYHLWEPCNMRCRFCFATFRDVVAEVLPEGHLAREDAERLVATLAPCFEKITFAGGEPTLCPWLGGLIRSAAGRGMTTMLVTNGSRLDDASLDALAPDLHWLVLSVDSASEATHRRLGRAVRGREIGAETYVRLAAEARRRGVRIKLNTVVTALNAAEDMRALVEAIRPERWKILRVLPVAGQNSGKVDAILCGRDAFLGFVERHRALGASGVAVVPEDNEDMRGTYAMIDPAGRFFDNVDGQHRYSAPILSAGVARAWSEVRFSRAGFDLRGGDYDFRRPR
jgi:radical S-adenosyl methionine domain-containing protein 2